MDMLKHPQCISCERAGAQCVVEGRRACSRCRRHKKACSHVQRNHGQTLARAKSLAPGVVQDVTSVEAVDIEPVGGSGGSRPRRSSRKSITRRRVVHDAPLHADDDEPVEIKPQSRRLLIISSLPAYNGLPKKRKGKRSKSPPSAPTGKAGSMTLKRAIAANGVPQPLKASLVKPKTNAESESKHWFLSTMVAHSQS